MKRFHEANAFYSFFKRSPQVVYPLPNNFQTNIGQSFGCLILRNYLYEDVLVVFFPKANMKVAAMFDIEVSSHVTFHTP